MFQIPVPLGEDDPEAVQRRLHRDDAGTIDIAFVLEGDHHHVVDRREGPHQHHGIEQEERRVARLSPASRCAPHPPRGTRRAGDRQRRLGCDASHAHSCTSVVFSLRIRMITSGISTGNAVITTATPRSGRARSNALRMPRVANRCVSLFGPPPVTKNTVLKSPSRKIVASKVNTRYRLASSGNVTNKKLFNPVAPSTFAAS